MIQSFRCIDTEDLFYDRKHQRWGAVQRVALRKLDQLAGADDLGQLRIPPGNRLELLRGERKGQYSIRINDQWRICFRWLVTGPQDVEIVDYH